MTIFMDILLYSTADPVDNRDYCNKIGISLLAFMASRNSIRKGG